MGNNIRVLNIFAKRITLGAAATYQKPSYVKFLTQIG